MFNFKNLGTKTTQRKDQYHGLKITGRIKVLKELSVGIIND